MPDRIEAIRLPLNFPEPKSENAPTREGVWGERSKDYSTQISKGMIIAMSDNLKDKKEFFVTVDGFQYRVLHYDIEYQGSISRFQIWHSQAGQDVGTDCPLSEKGHIDQWFKPSEVKKYGSREQAAIEVIKYLQNRAHYEGRQRRSIEVNQAANQFSLFA